jgi:hypothetical protein
LTTCSHRDQGCTCTSSTQASDIGGEGARRRIYVQINAKWPKELENTKTRKEMEGGTLYFRFAHDLALMYWGSVNASLAGLLGAKPAPARGVVHPARSHLQATVIYPLTSLFARVLRVPSSRPAHPCACSVRQDDRGRKTALKVVTVSGRLSDAILPR